MYTPQQIEEMPYFINLKSQTQPKLFESLVQGFAEKSKALQIPKDTYVFKQRMRLDTFYLLLKGRCLVLTPKSTEALSKEKQELQAKYPGLQALPQNFSWNWDSKRLVLVFRGTEAYPKEHLLSLGAQLTELQLPYGIISFLLPHLLENHVIRFKEAEVVQENIPLINLVSRKAPSTVIALDDCDFLTLDLSTYEDLLQGQKKQEKKLVEELLFQAFEEPIKFNSAFRKILQEIQNNCQVLKVLNRASLYSSLTHSQYVYLVIKGEFQICYNLTGEETTKAQYYTKDNIEEAQYMKFRKFIRQERQLALNVRNPLFITDEIAQFARNSKKTFLNKEYPLLKLSTGQIIGDEDFTYDCFNKVYHTFKCQCISASAKVLMIRKSDLYKICVVHDWFCRMFLKRCELKRGWLQCRFQTQYLGDLKGLQRQRNAVEEQIMLRFQCLEEEQKHKHTTKVSSTSPQKMRELPSKLQSRKVNQGKLSQRIMSSTQQIGILDYLCKLDRHKQMLLQHQIRKAVEPLQTAESERPSPMTVRRASSYRINRTTSLMPALNL